MKNCRSSTIPGVTRSAALALLGLSILNAGCYSTRDIQLRDDSAQMLKLDLQHRLKPKHYLTLDFSSLHGDGIERGVNNIQLAGQRFEGPVTLDHEFVASTLRASYVFKPLEKDRIEMALAPGVALVNLEVDTRVEPAGVELSSSHDEVLVGFGFETVVPFNKQLAVGFNIGLYSSPTGDDKSHFTDRRVRLIYSPTASIDLSIGWNFWEFSDLSRGNFDDCPDGTIGGCEDSDIEVRAEAAELGITFTF